MIATAQWIATQPQNKPAASTERSPVRCAAWLCLGKVALSLCLTCLFAIVLVWLIMSCCRMLAFSSLTPSDVVYGLTASK